MHYIHTARLQALPIHLQFLLHARFASTVAPNGEGSSNAGDTRFPFPRHPNPTPFQIFHLEPGASDQEIKSRYYDLVRINHPDSPAARLLPPGQAHARFQAITTAYDRLLRRSGPSLSSSSPWGMNGSYADDPYMQELEKRRRQFHRRQQYQRRWAGTDGPAYGSAPGADASPAEHAGWHDRAILLFGISCLGLSLFSAAFGPMAIHDQHHRMAANNLARARKEAREFGAERRAAIKKRVEEYREGQEKEMPRCSQDTCGRQD